jgi:hypothetical protein
LFKGFLKTINKKINILKKLIMKKITSFFTLGAIVLGVNLGFSQGTARVKVIHNSADAAAAVVDIYVNNVRLFDNLNFRRSTGFVDAPAGVELSIKVAPGTSTSSAESIYEIKPTLKAGSKYILVADGIVSTTGYVNPGGIANFGIEIYDMAREMATNMNNTDVLVHHGVTDAPTVDINNITGLTDVASSVLVNNASYKNFAPYISLPTDDYLINVTTADGVNVVQSYKAFLADSGLKGRAITIVASGFLNTKANSDGPAFGLFVATEDTGALLPLELAPARVQVIHNSADDAAKVVDVYVGGEKLLDNFAFRTASPFVTVNATGVELPIAVAPANSTTAADAIYQIKTTLTPGSTYVLVADGIVSSTGYTNVNGAANFGIQVYNMGREAAEVATNTAVLVHHGCTDAPTVDVNNVTSGTPATPPLVDNASYKDFAGYLSLPTADYKINVTTADGKTVVQTYSAPLQTLGLARQAIVVVASGFLDPSKNSNGQGFGLWVALRTGGSLVQLPVATTLGTEDFSSKNIGLNPSPASSTLNLDIPFGYDNASYKIYDLSGRPVMSSNLSDRKIDINGLSEGMYLFNLNADNKSYVKKFLVKR